MTEHGHNSIDPKFTSATSMIQFGYGVWVNLSSVTTGLALGFSAVALPQLHAPDSDVFVTTSEGSWIAGVLVLVSPIGCILCGYLMDRFGRRIMLILGHLPLCLGWSYTGFANSVNHIIIGRVITGIGMGMMMSSPRVYLTEISLPNMRGVIGSFPNVAMSLGIILQASFGSVLEWPTSCHICSAYSAILLCCNILLPETPYFLLQRSSIEAAEATLKKFRSNKHDIDTEMDELLDFKLDNDIKSIVTFTNFFPFLYGLFPRVPTGLTFKQQIAAIFHKSSCKPFFIIITYLLITQMSGVTIIIMWAVEILQNSKSSVDANMGNVYLGVTRLLSGILASIIIFNSGRRIMAISSAFFVGVVCVALSAVIHYATRPTIFPQLGYILYIISATLGHYTLPMLVMYELYPLQIRGILGGLSMSILNVMVFGANLVYPILRDQLGFANTILFFGISSLIGCVLLYIFLPETKDLTLQEIEEYYNEKRSTLSSQRRIRSVTGFNKSSTSIDKSRSLVRLDRLRSRSIDISKSIAKNTIQNKDKDKDNT